jgi:hypothetical protein
MTKCPKCGKEVPKKGWTMAGKTDQTGKKTDITFGMCKECALILILELRKSQK